MRAAVASALGFLFLVGSLARARSAAERGPNASVPQGNAAYHGPSSLGPMSITAGKNGAVPVSRLWRALGRPRLPPTDSICYKEGRANAYLWLIRGADDGGLVRGIGIASFPNCLRHAVYAARGFAGWKTDLGIGLGAPETQVLKAYGPPSAVKTPAAQPTAFLDAYNGAGGTQALLRRVPRDWRVLRYDGGPDSLSVAEFGVVAGRVRWIWLSDNE